jgi:hypothetical protein
MTARLHGSLKVIACNEMAFGGGAVSSVNSCKIHTYRCGSSLRDTSQTLERFFIPNYHVYWASREKRAIPRTM